MRVQSDTSNLNSDEEVLQSEHDLSVNNVFPSQSKMMSSLLHRLLYLSGIKFEEIDIRNHDDNWDNNEQNGSIPEQKLFATFVRR